MRSKDPTANISVIQSMTVPAGPLQANADGRATSTGAVLRSKGLTHTGEERDNDCY
jgi:hypothetical protein